MHNRQLRVTISVFMSAKLGYLVWNKGYFEKKWKKMVKCLQVSGKSHTFASLLKGKPPTTDVWRDGRVVDYSSLENCRTERCRGFESLSLRTQWMESTKNQLVPFLFYLLLPQIAPPSRQGGQKVGWFYSKKTVTWTKSSIESLDKGFGFGGMALLYKNKKEDVCTSSFFVENIGLEPMTSCMPCKRSSQLS